MNENIQSIKMKKKNKQNSHIILSPNYHKAKGTTRKNWAYFTNMNAIFEVDVQSNWLLNTDIPKK